MSVHLERALAAVEGLRISDQLERALAEMGSREPGTKGKSAPARRKGKA